MEYVFRETSDEWYDDPSERSLTEEEVVDFQQNLVMPVINYLCGGVDFLAVSRPSQDQGTWSLRLGDMFYEFKIGKEVGYDSMDPDDFVVFTELTISRIRHDLLEQVTAVRNSEVQERMDQMTELSQIRPIPDEVESEDDDEEEEESDVQIGVYDGATVWETRRYNFNPFDFSDMSVKTLIELLDEDYDCVWSSDSSRTGFIDTDEDDEIDEDVSKCFVQSITSKDVRLIKKCFARLGVHPALLS